MDKGRPIGLKAWERGLILSNFGVMGKRRIWEGEGGRSEGRRQLASLRLSVVWWRGYVV